MNVPSNDAIRDLLERATSDGPEPHPWSEVEHRAGQDDARSPARRTAVWLAAAACVLALVAGLVAVVAPDDEPDVPIDVPDTTIGSTTTTTTATTTTPTPTTLPTPTVEAGWTGGLLDEIEGGSLRPLESLSESDVVVPTGPSNWRVADTTQFDPDDVGAPDFVEWTMEVIEARPEQNFFGHVLYVTQSREPICRTTLGCQPSGESVSIDGVVWESIVVERIPDDDPEFFDETTLRARVGDRWLSVAAGAPQALTGVLLENPPIIEFLEGLRVGTPDDLEAIGKACWQCSAIGAVGVEGDPFSTGLPNASDRTNPDREPTETVEPAGPDPITDVSELGRPLAELVEGDVVVPTFIPSGLVLRDLAQFYEHGDGSSEITVNLGSAGDEFANSVRLWEMDEPPGPLGQQFLDDPNHPPVEIRGVTWGWNDFESARVANIGRFSVWLYLSGLDAAEAERFLEGLRAVPLEQFPHPITVDGADGLEVLDPADTEPSDTEGGKVVATDDEFEFTAVRVSDQVCTKLEQTTEPVTMTFAANCWSAERLDESGIVDFISLDMTDTKHLIIGVIDSTSATAVQITSPDGTATVVPTGPSNQAIDGRFFLARLDFDGNNGIDFSDFEIEDASP